MIRYHSHRQLSLAEFDWPFQTALDENNRWVKMSQCIPWDALAEGYYQSLSLTQGRPSKDARLVIGAVIIKHKLCLSDEETVAQIQENPYLQYFVGLSGYQMEAPFAPSLLVEIRKRMGQVGLRCFSVRDYRVSERIEGAVKWCQSTFSPYIRNKCALTPFIYLCIRRIKSMVQMTCFKTGLTMMALSAAVAFAPTSSAALATYTQNFEGMTPNQGFSDPAIPFVNDLDADGWQIYGIVYDTNPYTGYC